MRCTRRPHRRFFIKHLILSSVSGALILALGLFIQSEEVASSSKLMKFRMPAMMRIIPKDVRAPQQKDQTIFRNFDFNIVNEANDFSKGADARAVNPIKETSLDYSAILPKRLTPTSNGGDIATQIFDHTMTNLLNSGLVKNSSLGKAVKSVEKTMKAEVNLGGSGEGSTQHQVKFAVQTTQTKASMEYSGYTNAVLSYSVANRSTNLEVYETLGKDSRVVYHHSNSPDENRDTVSLRLNF